MGRKKKRQGEEKTRSSIGAILFGVVWVGAWSIGMAYVDWAWLTSIVNQVQTLSFPSVPGQIVSSEIVEEPGDESILYRPDVTYGYVVGPEEYISDKISQWVERSSFKKESEKVLAEYPVGKQVTVYYSPRDPSHAVLEPGFHPNNFFVALLLVPFNLIAIGSLAFTCGGWLRGRVGISPAELAIRATARGSSIRIYAVSPSLAAGMALFTLCFLTAIPAFFGSQFMQREILVAIAWGVVLVGTLYAWFRSRNSGVHLDLDDMERTLTVSLPARKASEAPPLPQTIGFGSIATVKAVRISNAGSVESRDDGPPKFQPTLVLRGNDQDRREIPLGETSESNARWVAGWLRTRLGLAG